MRVPSLGDHQERNERTNEMLKKETIFGSICPVSDDESRPKHRIERAGAPRVYEGWALSAAATANAAAVTAAKAAAAAAAASTAVTAAEPPIPPLPPLLPLPPPPPLPSPPPAYVYALTIAPQTQPPARSPRCRTISRPRDATDARRASCDRKWVSGCA